MNDLTVIKKGESMSEVSKISYKIIYPDNLDYDLDEYNQKCFLVAFNHRCDGQYETIQKNIVASDFESARKVIINEYKDYGIQDLSIEFLCSVDHTEDEQALKVSEDELESEVFRLEEIIKNLRLGVKDGLEF